MLHLIHKRLRIVDFGVWIAECGLIISRYPSLPPICNLKGKISNPQSEIPNPKLEVDYGNHKSQEYPRWTASESKGQSSNGRSLVEATIAQAPGGVPRRSLLIEPVLSRRVAGLQPYLPSISSFRLSWAGLSPSHIPNKACLNAGPSIRHLNSPFL